MNRMKLWIRSAFEGGGRKGGICRCLQAFERHGHKPRRLIGTSAGSITACLIAAGYSAQEALEAIVEVTSEGKPRFTTFMDTPSVYNDVIVKDQLGPWLRTELNNPAIPDLIEPMVDKLIASMIEVELIRHLTSLFLWGGWYAGDEFIRWLKEKLNVNNRCLADTTLRSFQAVRFIVCV
jgi:predicted acylesterase/phospholipase RssA